jgi:Multiubiquitin
MVMYYRSKFRALTDLRRTVGWTFNLRQKETPMSPNDHDKKPLTIIVNTRSFEWREKEITYEQVYDLAYPGQPLSDGDTATIEYSRGPNGRVDGSLTPSHSVHLKDRMVFDVYRTTRS